MHQKETEYGSQLAGLYSAVIHLCALNREKDRRLEAQSQFFANISHEFRTPLTLIISPLEQMLAESRDSESHSKLSLMLRNSRRLLTLVDQLLELAKFDNDQIKLDGLVQDIIPFLRNIVGCFNSQAHLNRIEYVFQVEEKEPVPVYFDSDKLEKILTNLLSNAFNHTPESGRISVLVERVELYPDFPSGSVRIGVCNSGRGIPSDQLPNLFDRFFRGPDSHDYKRKGTGIGLALTRELVKLHNGDIRVSSTYSSDQKGETRFDILLPVWNRPFRQVEPSKAQSAAGLEPAGRFPLYNDSYKPPAPSEPTVTDNPAAPCILVVEDNPDVRKYLRGELSPEFKVEEAVNGEDGIQKAEKMIPDIIISDVSMPGTNGYQLCRTLKNHVLTSHIPIILLTARAEENHMIRGLQTGADDYITKPFNIALLIARVRNLLEIRKNLQKEQVSGLRRLPGRIPVSPIDEEFYKVLRAAVSNHISDPSFDVDNLTGELNMGYTTLYRKVRALTGMSPLRFIRSYRLKRAAELIEAGEDNINEVAKKVGIPNASYFSNCFKKQFHCLPSQYLASDYDISEAEEKTEAHAGTVVRDELPDTSEKELILVVEDDADFRSYLELALESEYRIVEAVDGSRGLDNAQELIPDLIISDILIPEMNGYELCRRLKKDIRTCHIPVILLTGKVSEKSIIQGLEAGADDYIVKPFNPEMLMARIRNLIQLRTRLQQMRQGEMAMLPVNVAESQVDREFRTELHKIMKHHYADHGFNVEELARKLYISGASLYRKIKALSGETPSEYIRSYRLNRAAYFLTKKAASVGDIAFKVGFGSSTYFTRCFKETFFCLPSEYNDSNIV